MTKEEAIKYLQQLYPNGGHCWLDEQRMVAIGMAIQALQGEPKKCMYALDDFNDEDRKVTCDGCKEDCKYAKLNTMLDDALTKETKESWNERLDKNDYRERYKRIAQSESFKKTHEGISIGDTVPVEGEISEEPTIPDIVDEHFYEMLGEEPVSEDYKNALNSEAITFLQEQQIVPNFYADIIVKAVKHGANWQKKKMMAKAIDGHATFEFYGLDSKTYGTIAHDPICLDDLGLKDTDKVKVIVIKED